MRLYISTTDTRSASVNSQEVRSTFISLAYPVAVIVSPSCIDAIKCSVPSVEVRSECMPATLRKGAGAAGNSFASCDILRTMNGGTEARLAPTPASGTTLLLSTELWELLLAQLETTPNEADRLAVAISPRFPVASTANSSSQGRSLQTLVVQARKNTKVSRPESPSWQLLSES